MLYNVAVTLRQKIKHNINNTQKHYYNDNHNNR